MGDWWRDAVVGLRALRRSPGLAAGVAVTVGLGVGASLAIALHHLLEIIRAATSAPRPVGLPVRQGA